MAIDYTKLLKPTETLNASLPLIIEAFTNFYGEESRPRIEEKFKNMLLLGYHSTNSVRYILNGIYEAQPDSTDYTAYEAYCSGIESLEDKLSDKYNKRLLDFYASLLEEPYNEMINQDHSNFLSLVGDIIDGGGLIGAFSAEATEILNSPDIKESAKNNIKQARVTYFKTFGFDHGTDYEAYASNEKCRSIMPSGEMIELVEDKREEYFILRENEISLSTIDYNEIRGKIDAEELLSPKDGYDAELISEPCNCIYSNVKKVDGNYQDYPVIYISASCLGKENSLDSSLIHELNHRFEMDLISLDENGFTTKNGWESIYDSFEDKPDEDREYELFNEAINELIAQDITKSMHESGLYVFDTPNTKVRETSDYAAVNFLVKPFYERYKSDIIKSRFSFGSMTYIEDKVGKDNFQALNDLVNIFQREIYDTDFITSFTMGYMEDQGLETKSLELQSQAEAIMSKMDSYDRTHQTPKV